MKVMKVIECRLARPLRRASAGQCQRRDERWPHAMSGPQVMIERAGAAGDCGRAVGGGFAELTAGAA
jgi:hypothetical protein